MAKPANLSQKRISTPSSQPVLLEQFPKYPAEVTARFPAMAKHEQDLKEWMRKTNYQLGGQG
jgi:hypothetical protein